jgi:hypothetical protein
MIKKLVATICIAAFVLFGGCVNTNPNTSQPMDAVPVVEESTCEVDHSKLPQYSITKVFGVQLLDWMDEQGRKVFGTAQDKFDMVIIWYESDNGHAAVLLAPTGEYLIMHPADALQLYEVGRANGDYLTENGDA